LISKPGGEVFHYPTPLWTFHWIVPFGRCKLVAGGDGTLLAECLPGEGGFAIAGANGYPEGVRLAEQIAETAPGEPWTKSPMVSPR